MLGAQFSSIVDDLHASFRAVDDFELLQHVHLQHVQFCEARMAGEEGPHLATEASMLVDVRRTCAVHADGAHLIVADPELRHAVVAWGERLATAAVVAVLIHRNRALGLVCVATCVAAGPGRIAHLLGRCRLRLTVASRGGHHATAHRLLAHNTAVVHTPGLAAARGAMRLGRSHMVLCAGCCAAAEFSWHAGLDQLPVCARGVASDAP